MVGSDQNGQKADTVVLLGFVGLMAALMASMGYTPVGMEDWVSRTVAPVWAIALAISCTITLVGALWRDELTGWPIELAGRPGIAATCGGYAWGMAANADSPTIYLFVVMFAGLAGASAFRAFKLARRIKRFQDAIAVQKSAGARL